ncbi:hypothetical protein [Shinella sp. DD12]|uniref:hypothetical protein n=1 Tax=Shinella sp. DD12 TaxID=1410620 RepID=UPI0003C53E9D|nr:hypothetical protein [Shinella sp. DD12]EYR81905.1 hypothetical protein SHLA_4c001970 [Shinella sp. DD12]
MDHVLWIFLWLLSGAAGSAIILEFVFRRDGLDVMRSDIVLGAVMAFFFGPINLLVALGWVPFTLLRMRNAVVFKACRP